MFVAQIWPGVLINFLNLCMWLSFCITLVKIMRNVFSNYTSLSLKLIEGICDRVSQGIEEVHKLLTNGYGCLISCVKP